MCSFEVLVKTLGTGLVLEVQLCETTSTVPCLVKDTQNVYLLVSGVVPSRYSLVPFIFLSVCNQQFKVNRFVDFLITQRRESLTVKFHLDQLWVMWILVDHSLAFLNTTS